MILPAGGAAESGGDVQSRTTKDSKKNENTFLASGTIGIDAACQGHKISHIFKEIERVVLEILMYLCIEAQKFGAG